MNVDQLIQRELMEYENDSELEFAVDPIDGDLHNLRITLPGPQGTPYEEGNFFLLFNLPSNYPKGNPKIKFETKIYHPTISPDGRICCCFFDFISKYSYTIKQLMNLIINLLKDPSIGCPYNSQVHAEFATAHAKFEKTAREWTMEYAV